jgi:hypothetical protein
VAALTDAEVKDLLAAQLKMAPNDLPGLYEKIVPRAHLFGYQECLGRLMRRGFTQAQVDAWDRLAEFEGDLSIWKALLMAGAYAGFDRDTLAALDRREELDTVLVFDAGVYVDPATAEAGPGTVGFGRESTTGEFAWPPNDGSPGDPANEDEPWTRW